MCYEDYSDVVCINQVNNTAKQTFQTNSPIFLCVISYTHTCETTGITAAGANPDLLRYTATADSEYLWYGYCKCISGVPATPDGKPTPAIITRIALQSAQIPFLIIDAGSQVKPSLPYIDFGLQSGNNIRTGKALNIDQVKKAFHFGVNIGRQFAKTHDLIVLGESIPGGTTTALGVLSALGVEASFKVSSSMKTNPHDLKNMVVAEGMQNAKVSFGCLKREPFKATSLLGDPMIPSVAGIAEGIVDVGGRVMLAGGTQMAAVIAFLKALDRPTKGICIGTTIYVAFDPYSQLLDLVESVSKDIPIYASNLHLIDSSKSGLRAFSEGSVKEGVGAGGSSITAMLKSKGRVRGRTLLAEIEKEYENAIENESRYRLSADNKI